MAQRRYRVPKDDKGKFHFVTARYDDVDEYARRGLIPEVAHNYAGTVDQLRWLARQLLAACDQLVISMAEFETEPRKDEDELTDEEAAEMALLDALEKDNARDARHEADGQPLSIPKPEGGGLFRLLVKRPTDAKDEDGGSL
jgi:hypothetical protein